MKSLLIAAFTLALALTVYGQCDLNAVTTCVTDYADMVKQPTAATSV